MRRSVRRIVCTAIIIVLILGLTSCTELIERFNGTETVTDAVSLKEPTEQITTDTEAPRPLPLQTDPAENTDSVESDPITEDTAASEPESMPEEEQYMDTLKINKKTTLMIAHRGLSGMERENTNAAFIAAGNRSYYGIECDVYRTSDGRFAVIHDPDLERLAGVGITVEESTLAELQSYVLYNRNGKKDRDDLRVTTLENYIAICEKYAKHAVLELKSDFTEDEIARIIEVIEEWEYLPQVTFISFEYSNLQKVRAISPAQSVQYLFSVFEEDTVDRLAEDGFDADVNYRVLTRERVELMHSKGITVNCWTVNDPMIAEDLVAMGVDYITTNILE